MCFTNLLITSHWTHSCDLANFKYIWSPFWNIITLVSTAQRASPFMTCIQICNVDFTFYHYLWIRKHKAWIFYTTKSFYAKSRVCTLFDFKTMPKNASICFIPSFRLYLIYSISQTFVLSHKIEKQWNG